MRRLLGTLAIDLGPLRRHREFRLLFIGQAVSATGSMITYVAIPFQVYELTDSTLAVGLLGLVEIVSLLVTALLGGALADAHDRRRLVLLADTALLVLALVLVANAQLAEPQLWVLFVVAAGMSAAGGLQRPPLDAMLPPAGPARRAGSGVGARRLPRQRVQARRPRRGGHPDRDRRARGDLRRRRGDVPRLAGRAGTHARRAAAAGGGTAEPRPDPRRLALRPLAPGADRVLRGGHQRDAVRDPDRPVPGRRRPLRRPGGARPAVRRRARGRHGVHPAQRVDRPDPPARQGGRGERGRLRHGDHRVRLRRGALAVLALAAAGAADMSSVIFRQTLWNQTIPDHMRGRLAGIEQLSYSIGPTLGTARSGAVAAATSVRFSIASGGVLCLAGTVVLCALLPQFWRYDASEPVSA